MSTIVTSIPGVSTVYAKREGEATFTKVFPKTILSTSVSASGGVYYDGSKIEEVWDTGNVYNAIASVKVGIYCSGNLPLRFVPYVYSWSTNSGGSYYYGEGKYSPSCNWEYTVDPPTPYLAQVRIERIEVYSNKDGAYLGSISGNGSFSYSQAGGQSKLSLLKHYKTSLYKEVA